MTRSAPATRRPRVRRPLRPRGATGAGRPDDAASAELTRALQLGGLVESLGDAVIGLSTAGEIESWSDGARRMLGYSAAEVHGRSLLMLMPTDRVGEAADMLARVAVGEPVCAFDTQQRASEGRIVNVRLAASAVLGAGGRLVGAAVLMRDLSEQRTVEAQLSASEQRYRSVLEALTEGVVMVDVEGNVVAFNRSSVDILGTSTEELTGASSSRPSVEFIHEDGSPVLPDEHPAMISVRTGVPQTGVVMGVRAADGSVRWVSINSSALYRGGEHAPYAAVGSCIDITEQRETLQMLNAARLEDLERLSLIAEYRDDDTRRHTERVARTSVRIAAALGLDAELAETLRRAAPLHDVGKIGVPDRILLKPGPLTPAELAQMQAHATIGASILGESEFGIVRMGREIALTHHERWDGAGYPAGLRGEQIPITGRIVAVADTFDAMTHRRPYRDAVAVAVAVAEIDRCSGSQFDPHVVRAFMTLDHVALVDAD